MIRRRGISLLSTALVFLVFGAFTLLWLPDTQRVEFEDVSVDRTEAAARGKAHGAQKVIEAENVNKAGGESVRIGQSAPAGGPGGEDSMSGEQDPPEDSPLDGSTGDAPVPQDEGAMEESPEEESTVGGAGLAPGPPDDGAADERVKGDLDDTPPHVASQASPAANTAAAEPTANDPPPPSETLTTHPIADLVQRANKEHEALLARQSTTLAAAVAEYHRRYAMAPPPHFDKWFSFARSRNVSLTDEFDVVHDMLTPFWGLSPSAIRARATEALGYANNVQGVLIRGGQVALQTGGREWERDALKEMLGGFVEWLPDMDLVVNALDEPRVALPHEDLARLVERGRAAQGRVAERPVDAFTEHAEDLGDGRSIPEVSTSRFVYASRQSAWSVSRMSCPPDSPARSLDDAEDDRSYCASSPLCFVANTTAQTDICSSPSLQHTYGFFDRPNAFSVTHDLVPVFSASKLSSFQDIVVPPLWYWAGRVPYNESADVPWEEKKGELYWRGSTTGGFSRWGGWRRHHRQRSILHLNSDSPTTILAYHPSDAGGAHWETQTTTVAQQSHLFNVSFTHVGQCDPGDCAAQRAALPLAPRAPQHAAFAHRFLLDLDGNAFSGRFQTFLRSASLVLKAALFREWSAGWVVPWRDYVPLSMRGEEWVEAVRYLEGEGRGLAEGMAGREGVGSAEMEVWLFRLLLEYARVVDDDRENIGFSLES